MRAFPGVVPANFFLQPADGRRRSPDQQLKYNVTGVTDFPCKG